MDRLTPRQRRAIEMMTDGRAMADIAYELCVSHSTLKNDINLLYRRLGITNVPNPSWQLVAMFVEDRCSQSQHTSDPISVKNP